MPDDAPIVSIYADESCLGNGREGSNPGAAGGLMQFYTHAAEPPTQRDYWISERATTNNRMALRSAIEAFKILSAMDRWFDVYFTSDSNYLVLGMTAWTIDWVRRGWRRKGGALENVELWQELLEVANAHRHRWRWVKGHAAHPQNEYANFLATRAARELTDSNGAIESEFDEWLAAHRARGRMSRQADDKPDWASFKAGCTLRGVAPIRPFL